MGHTRQWWLDTMESPSSGESARWSERCHWCPISPWSNKRETHRHCQSRDGAVPYPRMPCLLVQFEEMFHYQDPESPQCIACHQAQFFFYIGLTMLKTQNEIRPMTVGSVEIRCDSCTIYQKSRDIPHWRSVMQGKIFQDPAQQLPSH